MSIFRSEDESERINDLAESVMMKLVDEDCSPRDIMCIVLLILSNAWVMFGAGENASHDRKMANKFRTDLMDTVKYIRENNANATHQ